LMLLIKPGPTRQ